MAGASFEEFKSVALSTDGWAERINKHGVRVSTKSVSGSAFLLMRGDGVISRPVKDVLDICLSAEKRMTWDKIAASCKFVGGEVDGTRIMHYATVSPGMFVWPREFVVEMRHTVEADGTAVVVGRSVKRADIPPMKGHVLGAMQLSGFLLQPLPENKTRVLYVLQVDPAGWLPASVVNSVSIDQPLGIIGIRKMLTASLDP